MKRKFLKFLMPLMSVAVLAGILISPPVGAHIDLLTPTPLLDGKAMDYRALKNPPFGAPGIDVAAATVTTVKAGSMIEVRAEVYVYHPGDIVVLYTTDLTGADIMPAWSIPNEGVEVPHFNLLYKGPVPDPDDTNIFTAQVQLPDIEGEIILVVRQVMHDKFDVMEDGSVSLKRVYYHQGAKLKLVK